LLVLLLKRHSPPSSTRFPYTTLFRSDPGLRVTGFGVIDVAPQKLNYVTSGCIKTVGQGLPDRLKEIVTGVIEIIESHAPSIAVVEKVFVNVNPQSTLLLGQARGAAISAAVLKYLNVA